MQPKPDSKNQKSETLYNIRTLQDLIDLNLRTLTDVANEQVDHKKAALVFTGSRTVTGALKVGLEAMKLGVTLIDGVTLGNIKKIG